MRGVHIYYISYTKSSPITDAALGTHVHNEVYQEQKVIRKVQ